MGRVGRGVQGRAQRHFASFRQEHHLRQSGRCGSKTRSAKGAETQRSERLEADRHFAAALRYRGQDHRQADLRSRCAVAGHAARIHRAMPGIRRQAEKLRRVRDQACNRRQARGGWRGLGGRRGQQLVAGQPGAQGVAGGMGCWRKRQCHQRFHHAIPAHWPGCERRAGRAQGWGCASRAWRCCQSDRGGIPRALSQPCDHGAADRDRAVTDDKVEVWVGTQNGESTIAAASEAAGIPLENVIVHKMHAGGGFGRRGPHQEYTKQAIWIAQKMPGTPVRLQWSREEDMKQGRYRPVALVKLRAGLDKDGNWSAWHVRQADQSIFITVRPADIKNGIDPVNVRSFQDNPYAVPNFIDEYAMRNTHVPPGFWRAVAHTHNPFFRECFIDEVVHAAGKDPVEFRRPLLHGKKDLGVLEAVVKAAAWDKQPAKGIHRGIAVVDSYGSFSAAVVEIAVTNASVIEVKRVVVAIDSGYVVHPDAVIAQIQSGVIWGLSSAMHEEVTINEGRVVQSNFSDYRVLTLAETPKIDCVLVPTGGFWGGVGEPPIGAVIPPLGNEIFAATGKRVRSLPFKNHGFSYKSA